MTPFQEAVIIKLGVDVLLALGYWIAASTGKYSFGHAGFMLIGAYSASILTLKHGWSLPLALVAGGVISGAGGAMIGWAALRLSKLYLAIVTLVFAEMLVTLVSRWDYVGGSPGLIGMTGTTASLVMICVGIVIAFLILLTRSRMGLAFEAIREDQQAAMACGIKVTLVSVTAFALSAAVTGAGGALAAHHAIIIQPSLYLPHQSLLIILFVVFGGTRYFWGAALGAIVLGSLPIYFGGLADWYNILYGALFVVLMIVRPQGLIGDSDVRWLKARFGARTEGEIPEVLDRSDKERAVVQ